MYQERLSKHAQRRRQQRGVPNTLVTAILDHHDVEIEARGGCRVLRVSRKQAESLGRDPALRQDSSRLPGIALVYSDTTGEVVTVLRDRPGRRGRAYRRGRR